MSFTAKYGADGSLDADEWGNETAKALRDAGYKSTLLARAPRICQLAKLTLFLLDKAASPTLRR